MPARGAPQRPLLSPEQTRPVYAGVPKDRARTELRIRRGLGAEIPRSVVLFAFPNAVIADVPLVAPFRYVVVENDVVIVDPARWRLPTCTRSLSPITTRSAAFDRPGGDDLEPPRQLLLWHPLGTQALPGSRAHLAHRWFCKLDLDDKIPHRSTFSENLGRFRESDMLRHIFERVVWEATAMGPQGRGLCCRCRRTLGPTPAAIMETRPMSSIEPMSSARCRSMAECRSTPVEDKEHHQPNDQYAFCESYTWLRVKTVQHCSHRKRTHCPHSAALEEHA